MAASTQDAQLVSDKLENMAAVISFLGYASQAMLDREEPVPAACLFGMYHAFSWVEDSLREIQTIIRAS